VRARDRFCASCGTPIAAANAFAPQVARVGRPVDSASLQVTDVSAAALREQRKVATILFADLSGSTPLAEKLDPEDLRGILASYFNQLARQIRRYEGTIDKYIGDAVMAVFGAPLSHEDDAERAVRAALAMQQSIAKLNDDLEREHGVRLSLRIGINTGEVVAGMLGGDVQSAYTVVGDAVNTAQRLESVAPLGGVIVSDTTRRLTQHAFEFEELPPVMLKGKAEPVVTYRVVRRRDEEIEPDASPFIGRVREHGRLQEALATAVTGKGRVLHISGDAGVGKSRLVSEFRASLADNVDRMAARCASFETNTPYALVSSLIRAAFRIHATDDRVRAREAVVQGLRRFGQSADDTSVELVLDVLAYGEAQAPDPQMVRRRIIALLRGLVLRAASRAPFVIVAEDLQWIDNASLEVLSEVVRDIAGISGLFITTSRMPWAPPWSAETMVVEALPDGEARSLMEAIVDRPVADEFAATLLTRTGGNPFFIEEVLRELQATGAFRADAGDVIEAATRLPPTIKEMLEARIDRLGDGPRGVIRPAAVIGRTFWLRLLERLVSGPLAPDLAALEQEALITPRATTPDVMYIFRQALIQEVVYETQLLSERRRWHGEVARAIEALYADRLEEFIDLLGYHYERSDDAASALVWLVRAGDRARRLFANAEALALYRSALTRSRPGAEANDAGAILEGIADIQLLIGRYDDALASLAAARERSPGAPSADVARTLRKMGTVRLMKADYAGASDAFAEARAALGGANDAEAAHIELQAGQLAWRKGDYASAREALGKAARIGEAIRADDIVAEGLKQLGNVSFLAGRREDAASFYRDSLAIYERSNDVAGLANVHSNLGVVYRRMGRWDDALRELDSSLRLRERMGDPWGIGTIHNNIGEVHRTRGELPTAIAAYERAIAVWTPIGYGSGVALALTGLGAAVTESGDARRGLEVLRDAEGRWTALGSKTYLPDLYRFIASAELAQGQLDAAKAAGERSLELAGAANARHQEAMTLRVLGEIALARGDRSSARDALERSRAALIELDEPAELARTEAVLARLS
jgi:class 3 adenylate cyclase/tetratricopeptide (TPR) repeat protein